MVTDASRAGRYVRGRIVNQSCTAVSDEVRTRCRRAVAAAAGAVARRALSRPLGDRSILIVNVRIDCTHGKSLNRICISK